MGERYYCVYILTNKPRGVLYTGVTSDLPKRVWEHKHDVVPGFTNRYQTHNLVWYEQHTDVESAILREKQIKRWRREWKCQLIEANNSTWQDLYPALL